MFQTQATNQELDGVWVPYAQGCELRIARAGNANFLNALDKAQRPHRKAMARGKLGTAKELSIQCDAMAKGILLEWRGPAMKKQPYTEETAQKALRHDSDLREFVVDTAADLDTYREEEVAEVSEK